MPWLFFLASCVGFAFTANAFWPVGNQQRWHIPSFLFSWLTIELAGHHMAWQVVATLLFVHLGALDAWPGQVGLVLSLASWSGLVWLLLKGRAAHHTMNRVLERHSIPEPHRRIHWKHLLIPFPLAPVRARRQQNITYRRVAGRDLKLDVYYPDDPSVGQPGTRRPAVVQIHGGAWIMGDKREQGIPLLVHMCEDGWVGFNVNYRLSPAATFPEPLEDVKYAVAWIRERADEFGIDPSFIAITGGSAGGHLSAMVALTAGKPEYQPGFEDADTSVQACVPLYGVYDLANRLGGHSASYVDGFIGPVVIKAFYDEEPERFHEASPIDRVCADAPPFLVIHGDRDTMSPLEDAQLFVARLRCVSHSPVLYAEIGGAQHAFDLFLSPRSVPVIEGVTAFLREIHRRYQEGLDTHGGRTSALPSPETPDLERP